MWGGAMTKMPSVVAYEILFQVAKRRVIMDERWKDQWGLIILVI